MQYFLRRLNGELGKDVRDFSSEVRATLLHYSWPGNVRELETVIRQCLLQSTGPVILPEFLPENLHQGGSIEKLSKAPFSDLKGLVDQGLQEELTPLYPLVVDFMERYLLTRTLRYTNGNQSRAAKILGITRASLRRKLHARNISVEAAISLKCGDENNFTGRVDD